MAKLDDKMKAMLEEQLAMVSTVSKDGLPNIGPKRTLRVFDDETLIYNENTGKQTYQNILENGKMAVAVVDRDKLNGYRFVGDVEIHTEGKIFDDSKAWANEVYKNQNPKAVVLIRIKKIYTLRIGPTAGDLIAE